MNAQIASVQEREGVGSTNERVSLSLFIILSSTQDIYFFFWNKEKDSDKTVICEGAHCFCCVGELACKTLN